MRTNTQLRPKLEFLEDRTCPALTIRSLPGMLVLSGSPTGAVDITGIGGKLFSIEDNGKFLGNYKINNLVMRLAHYKSDITIDLNDQKIGGNILIQRGNGNLNPTINTSPITILDGFVGGNVTATGGRGNETLALGGTGAGDELIVGGSVTVIGRNGNAAKYDGDDFLLRANSSIGGNLTLATIGSVAIGDAVDGGSKVGGNLVINSFSSNVELLVEVINDSTVGKNVSIVGTNRDALGGDVVAIDDDVVISGSFTANLLDGDNLWLLGGTYGGNVSLIGGNALNDVVLEYGAGATIDGSLSLFMGNGETVIGFPDDASVAGDFNVQLGNGNNDLGGGSLGGLWAGDVAGNVNVRVGNGDNFWEFDGATATVGGKLSFFAGNGENELVLGGFIPQLAIYFGNGDDELTFEAGTLVGNAYVDFGFGDDTYNDNGVTFLGSVTIINLP